MFSLAFIIFIVTNIIEKFLFISRNNDYAISAALVLWCIINAKAMVP